MPDYGRGLAAISVAAVEETGPMYRVAQALRTPAAASLRWAALALAMVLGACSGNFSPGDLFSSSGGGPTQNPSAIGSGRVRVGLILPLSAPGNAGVAAVSMRNAAELALAEFNSPDLQLLVKDDGGSAP